MDIAVPEGICVTFGCRQMSHIVFDVYGLDELDATRRNLDIAVIFMLHHPEMTSVSVGRCENCHPYKTNVARLSLLGHQFHDKDGPKCCCECGCGCCQPDTRAPSENNTRDDNNTIYECHRFQKEEKDRDRLVTFSPRA